MTIDELSAPVLVTWQLTRGCDLACLHCCTDSAPGRELPGELTAAESLRLASQIAAAGVPYVMLAGGEPTIVGHFLAVAERLGRGGVQLKIETNGQTYTPELARALAALPVRSLQVSLDGDTQAAYARQRPGGSLEKAWAACRLAAEAGLPLEITFAPSRLNLGEAEAVIDRAASLGAFRFNTGHLMRLGTAAKLWDRLAPGEAELAAFVALLARKERGMTGRLELCYKPFSVSEDLSGQLQDPPGTLLVLPDGRVKVSAALPYVCADLKRQDLSEAWAAYRAAWRRPAVAEAIRRLLREPAGSSQANAWTDLPAELVTAGG
ncbi:MAG: radical SAM protein [Elusimicrobia bacterium]|nr:radical SAM protein [Elusimicrobiota bacterium]